ncbi:hypothetical protein QQ045_029282 [Rhodiola kirilowii]
MFHVKQLFNAKTFQEAGLLSTNDVWEEFLKPGVQYTGYDLVEEVAQAYRTKLVERTNMFSLWQENYVSSRDDLRKHLPLGEGMNSCNYVLFNNGPAGDVEFACETVRARRAAVVHCT